jgi:hypothetical protein
MDPDAALQRLREIFSTENLDNPPSQVELAELFEAAGTYFQGLDHWLGNGGVLPKAWNPKHSAVDTWPVVMPPEGIREQLTEENTDALLADGFDDALVGIARRCGQPSLAVYAIEKCAAVLQQRDGMSYPDAIEYLEFNTVGAWVGDGTPIWLVT